MRCYRKILKISWTKRITNDEMPERVSVKWSMCKGPVKWRTEWISHIIRLEGIVTNDHRRGHRRESYKGKPRHLWKIIKDCDSYRWKGKQTTERDEEKLQTNLRFENYGGGRLSFKSRCCQVDSHSRLFQTIEPLNTNTHFAKQFRKHFNDNMRL